MLTAMHRWPCFSSQLLSPSLESHSLAGLSIISTWLHPMLVRIIIYILQSKMFARLSQSKNSVLLGINVKF